MSLESPGKGVKYPSRRIRYWLFILSPGFSCARILLKESRESEKIAGKFYRAADTPGYRTDISPKLCNVCRNYRSFLRLPDSSATRFSVDFFLSRTSGYQKLRCWRNKAPRKLCSYKSMENFYLLFIYFNVQYIVALFREDKYT